MKSRWLVIETPNDINNKRICDAVAASGREFKLVSIKDAYEDRDLWPYGGFTALGKKVGHVIVTGPVLPAQYCTDRYSYISWLDTEKTTCADYYPAFTKWIFQFPYLMMPLGDLKRHWFRMCSWLLGTDADDVRLFVRPNDNNKVFSARSVNNEELGYLQQAGQPGNVICVVSKVKEILSEFRLFFRGTEYLTGSLYKVSGNLLHTDFVPKGLIDWAKDVAKECHYPGLPPVWVMDVAEWPIGHYSVLEVSGALCAGFYSADIQKIVEAISQEVEG